MELEFDLSGLKALEKEMKKLSSRKIEEGFTGDHDSGLTNASLAYLLEEGRRGTDKEPPIPSRPAFKDHLFSLLSDPLFKGVAQNTFTKYIQGSISQETFLNTIGSYLEEHHKEYMRDWLTKGSSAQHNAPLTIKKKGFDRPFVETGSLVDSVKYEVI